MPLTFAAFSLRDTHMHTHTHPCTHSIYAVCHRKLLYKCKHVSFTDFKLVNLYLKTCIILTSLPFFNKAFMVKFFKQCTDFARSFQICLVKTSTWYEILGIYYICSRNPLLVFTGKGVPLLLRELILLPLMILCSYNAQQLITSS